MIIKYIVYFTKRNLISGSKISFSLFNVLRKDVSAPDENAACVHTHANANIYIYIHLDR